ncbi:MarR family transcriptional regulator [Cytophagaceae bacterium DM2B3-1]|uniref:HTH-type transcriptional regulator n=2 Tax=Xanthocytophaga TaxID=3078918 RepID=A0AAE3QRD8_9BACT|nr:MULTISPECIES: MarR family transcriptional regulator [Xanthocytophaga]MDJ1468894.1 MarR family transcriptional regulator [Xanthocytophaga flavus]MDJ1481810.1 MarR family transcriptional regulator [Xanthocytophaga flavus]MDJ1492068.1 MarR family transcriptional regulator [Xanthocytophaga flavus]MDJ1499532.1 MarR family transcriptional regulator [Xanthocytophaga agilis]
MELQEAKDKFVQAWGTLGSQWGINRTMTQIHALLLVSAEPLSADDIMEQLQISRGNVNMNVRDLIDWGLVFKVLKPGERKEFFSAEKDIWKVFKQVVKERRRRELEPVFGILEDVSKVEGNPDNPEYKAFIKPIQDIQKIASRADSTLETLTKADENWFFSTLLKLLK